MLYTRSLLVICLSILYIEEHIRLFFHFTWLSVGFYALEYATAASSLEGVASGRR